jgi:folate-binding protein YgfZ
VEGLTATRYVRRARAFVRVSGPDAEDLLERVLSNDIEALAIGEACDALLLTPKARVLALVRVHRRGHEEFLLSTDPETGDALRTQLVRARLRSKCEIEPEDHTAWLTLGGAELVDDEPPGEEVDAATWERFRIESGIPAWGTEIDDRVLPAEAGLTETHVSFTKGCYPGQEPIARLHYRGHPNRTLRRLDLEASEVPSRDAELTLDGKAVGRITSAVGRGDGTLAALGFVRTEVPADAVLALADGTPVRLKV